MLASMENTTSDCSDRLEAQESYQLVHVANFEYEEGRADARLGEGRYGVVYKARNIVNNQEVALKKLPPTAVQEEELKCIQRMNSPFVVQYFGIVNVDSDVSYIAMELCHQDLASFIQSHKKLSPPNLDTMVKCLAQGYLSLHQMGMIHRDLKPQNLLLRLTRPHNSGLRHLSFSVASKHSTKAETSLDSPSAIVARSFGRLFASRRLSINFDSERNSQPEIEVVKITDFGCSRLYQDGDEEQIKREDFSRLAGTFLYMAPEVGANLVEQSLYDSSIDIWSLGVVLFESGAGERPFDEAALCKLFLRAIDRNYAAYTAPTLRPIDAEKKYRDLVLRLLQIDPDKRIAPQQFHDFVINNQPLPPLIIENDDRRVKKNSKFLSKSRNQSAVSLSVSNRRSGKSSAVTLYAYETTVQNEIQKDNGGETKTANGSVERTNKQRFTNFIMYYGCCFCCFKNC